MLVGVNRYRETEPSPLTADAEGGIMVVDPAVEQEAIDALGEWRAQRDEGGRRPPRSRSSRASPRPART